MLNDSYWKEYNDGERAYLYSSDNKKIAYIQKRENAWDCTIYPKYIAEGFYLMNINSIEEAEWKITNYIYGRCNEIANQLHKIRDHLPMNDYVIESVSKVYINDELITPVPATIETLTNENTFYLRKPLNESKSNELVSKIVKFFDKDGMIVAKIIWKPDEPGDVNKVKIIGTMRNVIKDKVEPMDFTWEVPGRALINVTRWSRNSDVESRN